MTRSEKSFEAGARRRGAAGLAALCSSALLLLTPAALADNAPAGIDVGHSAYVLNRVNGQPPQERPVVIRLNDKIVFEEEVAAGHEAKTTIEFRDGSLFSLGPDAQARIDSFVFDPQRSTSQKTLAVTRGVFRYLSGFTSRDQEAKIKVPSGTLGIRGSLVIGVVTPGAPDFLFVAEGKAVFTNDAGSVEISAGQGIAILSFNTRPMDPKRMPPAVAAQVLRAILKTLPSSKVLVAETAGGTQLLISEGKANLLSAKLQEALERESRHGRHEQAGTKGGSIADQLTLLVEAAKLGLFDGRQGRLTEAQTIFLARIGHGRGADEAYLRGLVEEARALHHDNEERALRVVGHGVLLVTLIDAQTNPATTARVLQRAINALRINSVAAARLIGLFADAIAETESCDPDEAKDLAKGLEKVLKDPRNADLLALLTSDLNNLEAFAPEEDSGTPSNEEPNGPSGPGEGLTPGGAFGSFGSTAGTGVSTTTFGTFGTQTGSGVSTSPSS
jgi:hypothetical protein